MPQPFVKLYPHRPRAQARALLKALLTAYTGVLCSPAFVTLEERPGTAGRPRPGDTVILLPVELGTGRRILRSLADQGALHNRQSIGGANGSNACRPTRAAVCGSVSRLLARFAQNKHHLAR